SPGSRLSVPGESYLRSDREVIESEFGDLSRSGVCAQVKLRLDQEAVMTRSAFRGTLELTNNQPDTTLADVAFDLDVRDLDGNDARDLFNIRVTKLSGLAAIDGTGEVGPQSSGV